MVGGGRGTYRATDMGEEKGGSWKIDIDNRIIYIYHLLTDSSVIHYKFPLMY